MGASLGDESTTERELGVDSTFRKELESSTLRDAVPACSTLESSSRLKRKQLPSLPAGTRVGDYAIDRPIGEGAVSEVYLAVHRTIGSHVAIKVISERAFGDPIATERFISEARAVAHIHHPGIVHVFGLGRFDDGRVCLIMEWLQGETLAARLQRGPVLLREALDILLQLSGALRAAHERQIIHRDLKPENVFLQAVPDDKPVVKILDFGLAKRVGSATKTRSGQLLGTPLYMSPEQCRGRDVDHRTDIYALGCLAYHLILGRPPFEADNVAEILTAHLKQPPPAPREMCAELAPDLDRLLHAMIAKDPDARPTLGEVRRSIQRMLGVQTGAIPIVTIEPPPPPSDETTTAREAPIRFEWIPFPRMAPTPEQHVAAPPKRRTSSIPELIVVPPTRTSWRLPIALAIVAFVLLIVLLMS